MLRVDFPVALHTPENVPAAHFRNIQPLNGKNILPHFQFRLELRQFKTATARQPAEQSHRAQPMGYTSVWKSLPHAICLAAAVVTRV